MTTFFRKALFLFVLAIASAGVVSAQTYTDGLAAIQLKEWDKAVNIFTALTKANPTDQNAWLSLGNVYLATNQKDQASAAFKSAYDAKPDGGLALVANGRVLLLENRGAEAEKQFEKATRNSRKDMNVWRQVGESYIFYIAPGDKRPNFTRAEQYLKSALDVNSKDFQTLMSLAFAYKELGNGGPAAQYYEYAALVEPKNPLPPTMLGKVYRTAKLFDKAIEYFNKAIAISPRYTPALRNKAEYLYLSRKWEQATQAYKDLVNNGDAVTIEDEMQLANSLFITKDCKGVSEIVEKILKKDGTKNYLRRLQAYCDYENGEYQRGLDLLNSYFKNVTPDKILPSDYEYLGKLLVKTKGDTATAIMNLQKAIEVDTAHAHWTLYEEISKLEYARKNYCGSATALQMFLDSTAAPTATNYYDLGIRYYFCKEDTLSHLKAATAFKKVTEMSPTAAIGWVWLAKSEAKTDPSPEEIEAKPELASQYGKATVSYEKYVELSEVAGFDKEKNKKDLLAAYQYLAYVYFVANNAEKFNAITAKWLQLDPENATIKEMQGAFGKEPTPASPSTTPKQGGSSGGNDGNKRN